MVTPAQAHAHLPSMPGHMHARTSIHAGTRRAARRGPPAQRVWVEHDGVGLQLVQQVGHLSLAPLLEAGEGVGHQAVKVGLAGACLWHTGGPWEGHGV